MQIVQLQFDGETFDPNEQTDVPLWSTGEFIATLISPLVLFSYVETDPVPGSNIVPGGQLRPATLLDTNMTVAGQMNNDEGMKIHSIGIEWFSVGGSPAADVDPGYECDRPWISGLNLQRIFTDMCGTLKIASNVSQIRLPVSHFPLGWDVVVANGGARRADGPAAVRGIDSYVLGHNGISEIRGQMVYQPIFEIAPTETFSFELQAPDGAVTSLSRRCMGRVHLFGRRRRPQA